MYEAIRGINKRRAARNADDLYITASIPTQKSGKELTYCPTSMKNRNKDGAFVENCFADRTGRLGGESARNSKQNLEAQGRHIIHLEIGAGLCRVF